MCRANQVIGLFVVFILVSCGGGGDGGGEGSANSGPLSIEIEIPSVIIQDSDLSDVNFSSISNNSIAEAQSVSNPVSVLGYVAIPITEGSPPVDTKDFYSIMLEEGQQAELLIADLASADLDLYLLDQSGSVIDDSSSADGNEVVTAPLDGKYFLNVQAFDGGSNYTLNAGITSAVSTAASIEALPGDIIVRFKTSVATTQAQLKVGKSLANSGLIRKRGAIEREVLFSIEDMDTSLKAFGFKNSTYRHSKHVKKVQSAKDIMRIVRALRARDDVLWAEPNYIRRAMAVPNDEYFPDQWHYPFINLPAAWDNSQGNGTIVAVIDTGVDLLHPDLAGQFVADGYDFVSNAEYSADGDEIDSDPTDPGDRATPAEQSSFHGTHVSGTIAAATNNSVGVAGVAYGAKIMPVRVLGVGGGTSYDVLQGMRYAAGLDNDSGTVPVNVADVLNLSLGGPGYSSLEQSVVHKIVNSGILTVAAAGNETSSTPEYPASYDGVVSVSAMDINGNQAWYSNYGTTIDLTAPGGETDADSDANGIPDGVLSTMTYDDGSRGYTSSQGTSMAAPHVAGVVALMKSVWPEMTSSDFDSLLLSGTITSDVGAVGRDDLFGHGLIDAAAAVNMAAAAGVGALPALLQVAPESLSLGFTQSQSAVTVTTVGGESLQVLRVQSDAPWLTVSEAGVGIYTLAADRSSLLPGVYGASVEFVSAVNTVTVTVSLLVDSNRRALPAAIEPVWIGVLSAPETPLAGNNLTVAVIPFSAVSGVNQFDFTDIEDGTYIVIAGTDIDNDNIMCEPGELCGAYPDFAGLHSVSIDAETDFLSFPLEVRQVINEAGPVYLMNKSYPVGPSLMLLQ